MIYNKSMNNNNKISLFYSNKSDGNVAFHVKDNKNNVLKNRLSLSAKYNVNIKNLRYMNQIHTDNIVIVDKNSEMCINNCDAIITNEIDLPLMVMVADCIPILAYDENKKVIAAIHAGRNSTFLQIVSKTVLKMINEFDCNVNDIRIDLGPSIQKCCYEVSTELANIVKKSFGDEFVNNRLIDLQGINKKLLLDIGINKNNINISNICTKCSGKNFYSYRLDKNCGRFCGVITILK